MEKISELSQEEEESNMLNKSDKCNTYQGEVLVTGQNYIDKDSIIQN